MKSEEPRTELGKFMLEWSRKVVAGETILCTCDKPKLDPTILLGKWCVCGGWMTERGYWLFE